MKINRHLTGAIAGVCLVMAAEATFAGRGRTLAASWNRTF